MSKPNLTANLENLFCEQVFPQLDASRRTLHAATAFAPMPLFCDEHSDRRR
jgi:hypothetical protein